MKKLSKICCRHSDTDEEQPRLVRRSVLQSGLSRPNREVLRVRKVENAFSVANARFSPNGNSHSIVINLDKEDGTKMELIIDGEPFYEADTREKIRGNAELNIDGMAVDFVWDLAQLPKFSFYVREAASAGGGGGSSSNDGGDAGEAKQWEDHVHVYLLQILGLLE
ncbi:hypothetical protein MA16_Dca021585 [Dendrobium catenatum]|uniref:Uncharacterized protein n=1 Tax=Dendrobium catenatum TaxID=906689 RepID=A0A2I0VKL3_9ASPA|nr:hypothetical protein MA16_Dca021585 [Dendrobium catenatum]